MARRATLSKANKSELSSIFDEFKIGPSSSEEMPNIASSVELAEAPWGLGHTLYPAQKFLLRLVFNEPWDENNIIPVRDITGERVIAHLTEPEYLQMLYEDGRCTIDERTTEIKEVVWSGGRKTSKSFLIAVMILYQAYKCLSMYNPHEYFGISEDSEIRLTNLASTEEQASHVFNNVRHSVSRSPIFRSLLYAEPSQHKISFFTKAQVEEKKKGGARAKLLMPTVVIRVMPSTASSLRGANNAMIVFDELAHFQEKSRTQSGKAIYDSVKPSIAAFSDFAKTVSISSPGPRSGQFWNLYNTAMRSKTGDIVYIETPTAEFNPTIPHDFLVAEYTRDPAYFMVEYGAKWAGSFFKFIQQPDVLEACVQRDPSLVPERAYGRELPYYVGIDLATEYDGTVYAIGHAEEDVVVIDNVWFFYPGMGKYSDYESLPFIERVEGEEDFGLIPDLIDFTKRFQVHKGVTDQWNLKGFVNLANLEGINWIEGTSSGDVTNYEVAELFTRLYREDKLILPDIPEVIENIKDLDRITVNKRANASNARRMYKVKAPAPGEDELPPKGHDDIWSAVSRCVWLVFNEEIATGKSLKYKVKRNNVKKRVANKIARGSMESQRMREMSRQRTGLRSSRKVGSIRSRIKK